MTTYFQKQSKLFIEVQEEDDSTKGEDIAS